MPAFRLLRSYAGTVTFAEISPSVASDTLVVMDGSLKCFCLGNSGSADRQPVLVEAVEARFIGRQTDDIAMVDREVSAGAPRHHAHIVDIHVQERVGTKML